MVTKRTGTVGGSVTIPGFNVPVPHGGKDPNFGPGGPSIADPVGAPYTPPPPSGEEEQPGRPDWDPPEGFEWYWDDDSKGWRLRKIEGLNNDLFARMTSLLDFWGINNEDSMAVLKDALKFGWGESEFRMELRKSKGYLANPLFAANVERAKRGLGWMDESVVLNWGAEAKRLAKQYGFTEPSNNYLANGLLNGYSMAEIEHKLQIEQQVREYGGGVRWVAENILGVNLSDQDLYEVFSDEHDTAKFDQAYKDALYRGRPVALGLGVRSQAEADAFRALGVDPTEAFKRYQNLAENAPRFARLGAIEDLITRGLPADWNPDFSTTDNSVLVNGLLFNRPEAQDELNSVVAREIARFKQGGGAVASQSGQQLGLLSGAERQTYG